MISHGMTLFCCNIDMTSPHMRSDCCCSISHTCYCWSGSGCLDFGGSIALCASIVSETEIALPSMCWIIVDFILALIGMQLWLIQNKFIPIKQPFHFAILCLGLKDKTSQNCSCTLINIDVLHTLERMTQVYYSGIDSNERKLVTALINVHVHVE